MLSKLKCESGDAHLLGFNTVVLLNIPTSQKSVLLPSSGIRGVFKKRLKFLNSTNQLREHTAATEHT